MWITMQTRGGKYFHCFSIPGGVTACGMRVPGRRHPTFRVSAFAEVDCPVCLRFIRRWCTQDPGLLGLETTWVETRSRGYSD